MAEASTEAPKETVYTLEDLKAHNTDSDCWIAINGSVYDVSAFLEDHPGGPEIMMESAGQDATNEFEDVFHSKAAKDQLKGFKIGKLPDDEGVRVNASSGGRGGSAGGDDAGSMMAYVLPVLALAAALGWKFFYSAQAAE